MRQTEILVAVRISKSSGRDLLTGIFRFFEENPAWQLHLVQYDEDFTPEIVRGAPERGFSGIIATIPGADGTVEALVESPLPVVFMNFADCSLSRRRGPTAFIRADNTAAGRLAASALIKSGSRESYAYVPKTDEWWCAERGRGFAEVLAKNGKKCQTFVSVARPSAPFEDHEGLAAFVAGLPKPAAVYAATDECALKVLAARTGFSGQNRLSHVFKARFGQAPEHWRKKRIP